MNYTQRGIRAKQQALASKSGKWGRKFVLNFIVILLVIILAVGIWGISAAFGMYKGILASTPRITSSQVAPVGAATFIYDKNGKKIDELVAVNANRIFVTTEQIPDHMKKAVVAIEDARFYENSGVDYIGMLRAGYNFIVSMGKKTEGASTITQQLLKNTIFTDWTSEGDNVIKKLKRKLQEQYLAVELTKILSKDEILVRYLNTINTGQNTLGVEAAAQRYFGKSVSDLTLSECATIAVITQNPSKWNPISHPDNNAERRKKCLNDMLELEFITQEQYDEAMADDVYSRIERHNINYLAEQTTSSYFSDAVHNQVKKDLLAAGYSQTNAETLLYSGGLRIMTTLDPDIQAIVDEEVNNPENYPKEVDWQLEYALTIHKADGTHQNYSQEMMTKYFKENVDADFDLLFDTEEDARQAVEDYKATLVSEGDEVDERFTLTVQPQVSVVIMDQYTGEVLAMSGGRGVKEGRLTLNRATDTYRGPGSTFKVLAAYAPGIDSAGLTLSSIFVDAPFSDSDGRPVSNWWKTGYKGILRVRQCIEQSANVATVKALTQISPRLGYDYIKNFGFEKITDHYVRNGMVYNDDRQSLALGGVTIGVSNLELTAAYASIANLGSYIQPKLYTQVLDAEGNVILDNTLENSHQVLKDTTAYLLTSAMQDVIKGPNGTAKAVNFGGMSIAGKTGTATDNKDVWFTGYSPYYTCSTWAGYDTPTNIGDTSIAKDLWRNIMKKLHTDLPNTEFERPESIVEMEVCSLSGKLPDPTGICNGTLMKELFAEENVPTETCNVHYYGQVCSYEGVTAAAECPFQYTGTCTLTPIEDQSLFEGSTVAIEQPDGSFIYQTPRTSNICSHDTMFLLQPDAEARISQIWYELTMRQQQAQAAADAAAAAAGQ